MRETIGDEGFCHSAIIDSYTRKHILRLLEQFQTETLHGTLYPRNVGPLAETCGSSERGNVTALRIRPS